MWDDTIVERLLDKRLSRKITENSIHPEGGKYRISSIDHSILVRLVEM